MDTFVAAKRYQRGGVAGLAPGEVPIIAHKGEVIIPKGAVGKGKAKFKYELGSLLTPTRTC